jgi:hypothetical protein
MLNFLKMEVEMLVIFFGRLGTFCFQDVTSVDGYSLSGVTATETENLFRAVLIGDQPKTGHITVVLQRNSFRTDERVQSSALSNTSSVHSEIGRESPMSCVMIDTSCAPSETRREASMSCVVNDTFSAPSVTLGESSISACATALAFTQNCRF